MNLLLFHLPRIGKLATLLLATFLGFVFLPLALVIALHISNWDHLSGSVEIAQCRISNGHILMPGAIPSTVGAADAVASDTNTNIANSCSIRLKNALLFGSHKLPCYTSTTGNSPASSPVQFFEIFGLTISYLALLILVSPSLLQYTRKVWSTKNPGQLQGSNLFQQTERKQALIKLFILSAAILLVARTAELVSSDAENILSRDWTPSQCKVIEACKASSKRDISGMIYERRMSDTMIRSSSLNGFEQFDSAPSTYLQELISAQQVYFEADPGSQTPCYFNPAFPAQMKLRPYQYWSAIPYIKELMLATFIALTSSLIVKWSVKRISK